MQTNADIALIDSKNLNRSVLFLPIYLATTLTCYCLKSVSMNLVYIIVNLECRFLKNSLQSSWKKYVFKHLEIVKLYFRSVWAVKSFLCSPCTPGPTKVANRSSNMQTSAKFCLPGWSCFWLTWLLRLSFGLLWTRPVFVRLVSNPAVCDWVLSFVPRLLEEAAEHEAIASLAPWLRHVLQTDSLACFCVHDAICLHRQLVILLFACICIMHFTT